MKVLVIQNCTTENIGLYKKYFIDNFINYDIFHAYLGDRFPPIKKYDFFIVGGTPISAYEINEHNFLKNEWRYLKQVISSNKPCFGICFGGQLLAKIFGAKVRRNPVKEIGIYEVELTPPGRADLSFKGFPDRFSVFHWHGDTFDLPAGARLLARGKDCINQAFRYRNVLGVQFHLEITSKEAEKWTKVYADELVKENKTREQIVNECRMSESSMKDLAYQLLSNLLAGLI